MRFMRAGLLKTTLYENVLRVSVMLCLGLGLFFALLGFGIAQGRAAAADARDDVPPIWMGGSGSVNHSYPELVSGKFGTLRDSGVSALKVYLTDLAYGSDEQVRSIISFVRTNGLRLAVEGYLVTAFRDSEVSEGEGKPGMIDAMIRRVKQFGGKIDYFQSDETLLRAHEIYHHPISEVAQNAAHGARTLRLAFPEINISTIEPFPTDMMKLEEFFRLFAVASGKAFDAFSPDIAWNSEYHHVDWEEKLETASKSIHQSGMRLEMIYNGNDNLAPTASSWVSLAERRIIKVECNRYINVNDAIVQTWRPYPDKVGPRTTRGTLLNLVVSYYGLSKICHAGGLGLVSRAQIVVPESRARTGDAGSLKGIRIDTTPEESKKIGLIVMTEDGSMNITNNGSTSVDLSVPGVAVVSGSIAMLNKALDGLKLTLPINNRTRGQARVAIEVFDANGILDYKEVEL